MEKKEFIEALEDVKTQISEKMDEVKTASEEKAEGLKSDIAELSKQRNEMQKQLDSISTEIEKSKKTPSQKAVDFASELKGKLKEEIVGLKVKGAKFDYEVKSFLQSANDSITTGSELPVAFREAGVNKAPDRSLHLYNIIPVVPIQNGRIVWVERKTRTDNSEWTAEGTATASQTVLGYKTVEATFKKLSSFIKVSREAMDDIDFIMSEINDELMTLLMLKLDANMLDGTVVGDANSFNGLEYYAQAFAPGYTVEAGKTPDDFAVILAAANQIKQSHFNCSHCLVSVKKFGEMQLIQNEDGDYKFPWFAQNGLINIGGVQVVPSTDVDDDDFLAIDRTKAKLWVRKGLAIEVFDQNEDDALADLKTVRASMRSYLQVKGNDESAFVKGTFTAAKSTLSNP